VGDDIRGYGWYAMCIWVFGYAIKAQMQSFGVVDARCYCIQLVESFGGAELELVMVVVGLGILFEILLMDEICCGYDCMK